MGEMCPADRQRDRLVPAPRGVHPHTGHGAMGQERGQGDTHVDDVGELHQHEGLGGPGGWAHRHHQHFGGDGQRGPVGRRQLWWGHRNRGTRGQGDMGQPHSPGGWQDESQRAVQHGPDDKVGRLIQLCRGDRERCYGAGGCRAIAWHTRVHTLHTCTQRAHAAAGTHRREHAALRHRHTPTSSTWACNMPLAHTYTLMHTSRCALIHSHMCTLTHTLTQTPGCACSPMCTHRHTHKVSGAHSHMYTHAHTHTDARSHTCTLTRICTKTHMHAHTRACSDMHIHLRRLLDAYSHPRAHSLPCPPPYRRRRGSAPPWG